MLRVSRPDDRGPNRASAEKEKTRSGPADVPICRRPRRDPRGERAGTTASSHDRAGLAARGEVTRHAKETARRTCCWFAPGWRYSVRSCKIWSMPACCGCHMGGGGGAAMLSPRPRPRRVSVDRSSRDGDGQTVGSRLVKGGTVRRRAPLAVRPDVSIDHPRRRKLVAWRAARVSAVASSAKLGTIFRRETPFAEPFSGRFRSARPRARPPMSGRARASSPVARRAHDAAATALTLCISAYVLWVLAVRFPLVRRARPRVSRDPETRHLFSRAASPSRTRGSRSGARAVSVTHARSANHSRGPSLRPSTRAVTVRTPPDPTRHLARIIFNRAPSRGSRTSARARARLSGALLARGFPSNPPAAGLLAFLRANVPAAIGFVAPHSLLPPPQMYRLCRGVAAAAERRRARGDDFFQCSARFAFSRKRFARARVPGAFCTTW